MEMHKVMPEAFVAPRQEKDGFRMEVEASEYDGIRNIVFDLGGVVIDLRREAAVEAYVRLGVSNANDLLGLYRQEEPFLGIETGRITSQEFFDEMRPLCGGADDRTIAGAFCQFLVGIPVERLRRIQALRRAGFRTYVLSNTNPVMYDSWIAREFRKDGLSINDYFDGIVVSFQELTCKPDVELFRRVLTRYSLKGHETLMLDDGPANVDGARRAGMRALRVGRTPGDDMLALTAPLLNR